MSEPINLRQARKQRARAAKEKLADENRVKFGQTGAEKRAVKLQNVRDAKRLDGKQLDATPPKSK